METDEWLYSELLKFLKEKQIEEDSAFQQIELPVIQEIIPIGDENTNKENIVERGVIIIQL